MSHYQSEREEQMRFASLFNAHDKREAAKNKAWADEYESYKKAIRQKHGEEDMSPFESKQSEKAKDLDKEWDKVWGKEWEEYVSKSEKEDNLEFTTPVDEKKTPKHYDNSIQPIDYMYSIMNDDEYAGFCRGNVIKYISRYPAKGGHLDLEKAKYYLDELIRVY
tara:strand:+ start:33 stop:524 length:492 start_codon:yes stop_codon:yes gene_type:complete